MNKHEFDELQRAKKLLQNGDAEEALEILTEILKVYGDSESEVQKPSLSNLPNLQKLSEHWQGGSPEEFLKEVRGE